MGESHSPNKEDEERFDDAAFVFFVKETWEKHYILSVEQRVVSDNPRLNNDRHCGSWDFNKDEKTMYEQRETGLRALSNGFIFGIKPLEALLVTRPVHFPGLKPYSIVEICVGNDLSTFAQLVAVGTHSSSRRTFLKERKSKLG